MEPSEVRAHVLQDHDDLRSDLNRLEDCSRNLGRDPTGDREIRALSEDAAMLLAKLQSHMLWEERYLLPALREADAWGEERAQRLITDHREQRALLNFILERLLDEGRPNKLVLSDIAGLIDFLREDMEEEERDLLDERVLRDDSLAIEIETG